LSGRAVRFAVAVEHAPTAEAGGSLFVVVFLVNTGLWCGKVPLTGRLESVSEGIGEARPEAEGELALARLALDVGELAHAAAHAGNAIAADPSLRAVYEM